MKKADRQEALRIGIGIGAIEDFAKAHKIPFRIHYSPVHRHWSITVMSQHFKSSNIITVMEKALELVVRVKDEKLHKELFK